MRSTAAYESKQHTSLHTLPAALSLLTVFVFPCFNKIMPVAV